MANRKITLIVLLVFVAVISIPPIKAASTDKSSRFGVQPTKIEFDTRKNNKQEAKVKVINYSNHPIKADALFNDFIFTNNPKNLYIFTTANELPVSAVPFLDVSPNKAIIKAKSNKDFTLTYTPSKNKIKGSKYSALLFEVGGYLKRGDTIVNIAGRIATTIFITPDRANIKRDGQLISFNPKSSMETKKPIFGLNKTPQFEFTYQNKGNTHLNVDGSIYLRNFFTGALAQRINFSPYEVYPSKARTININMTKKSIGLYKASITTKANLYDFNKEDSSQEKIFFYIPFKYVIVLVLILFASLIYSFFKIKRIIPLIRNKFSSKPHQSP